MNIISCANPFGTEFKEAAKTFDSLKVEQQVAAVIASIISGILTPIFLFTGSFVAFTKSVQYFHSHNSKTDSIIANKAKAILVSSEEKPVRDVFLIDEGTALQESRLEEIEAVPPEVKQATVPKLPGYGLSIEEYEDICAWYAENKAKLVEEGINTHVTADKTGLSRTVIYIANGPHKGLHIRTKMTLGTGSFNKATRALHVDTGAPKVARAGRKIHVKMRELACNDEYREIDPSGKYFTTGSYVVHQGSIKDRNKLIGACPSISFPCDITDYTKGVKKHFDVEKVTLIMDEMPNGELQDDLGKPLEERERSPLDYLKILIHLNEGLILAHKAGKVDVDYKPENIFMQGSIPKMGDFGMAHSIGDVLKKDKGKGTLGFISPEMASTLGPDGTPLVVQPANQMWIQGCVMALMFKGIAFEQWTEQKDLNLHKIKDPDQLNGVIEVLFPEHKTIGTIDWCIAQCLQYKPEDRITAKDLQHHLGILLSQMK